MSRIGRQPVNIPEGVTVDIKQDKVEVRGPKGILTVPLAKRIAVAKENSVLIVTSKSSSAKDKAMHGTIRSLLANAIVGVTKGWSKTLELVGVGYRASLEGKNLILNVGYSHPVRVSIPEDLSIEVKKNKITVSGIDKQLVGELAAQIRRVRPPDSYKGKGIRYQGEKIRLKPGKAAKTGATE